MRLISKYKLEIRTFIITFSLLLFIHLKAKLTLLLLERFLPGWGIVEITTVSFYAAFLLNRMKNPLQTPKWRSISWTIFTIVFFSQLILGLCGIDQCLMTGKLHLPVPAMIIAGPIYRFEISFMPILFLSTIILSGPAWCSQLCYFGAIDNLVSGKGKPTPIRRRNTMKIFFLLFVILTAILLRLFSFPVRQAAIVGIIFGTIGLLTIIFISRKKRMMFHCTIFCPVGTIVTFFKFINPFRIVINSSCNHCMKCITHCKYDALNKENILVSKPAITCTNCGDCINSCDKSAIQYKFLNASPNNARLTWLTVTVILHAVFLALARI